MAADRISLYLRVRAIAKRLLPSALYFPYRYIFARADRAAIHSFMLDSEIVASFRKRLGLVYRLYVISYAIHCAHTQEEVLSFCRAILTVPPDAEGCVVEAGAYMGGSTAKFSIAARLANRELVVFDSFDGIPEHDEPHDRNIFGGAASFPKGSYRGTLDEVKANVARYGEIDVCSFVQGWFDETMPSFSGPIAAIYLDVDLAESTGVCLRHLYPLLAPGGVLYSQDGHLPLVIEVFGSNSFWQREVGCARPHVEGLGTRKLIWATKPADAREQVVG